MTTDALRPPAIGSLPFRNQPAGGPGFQVEAHRIARGRADSGLLWVRRPPPQPEQSVNHPDEKADCGARGTHHHRREYCPTLDLIRIMGQEHPIEKDSHRSKAH
jgi:hypothetical protein